MEWFVVVITGRLPHPLLLGFSAELSFPFLSFSPLPWILQCPKATGLVNRSPARPTAVLLGGQKGKSNSLWGSRPLAPLHSSVLCAKEGKTRELYFVQGKVIVKLLLWNLIAVLPHRFPRPSFSSRALWDPRHDLSVSLEGKIGANESTA